MVFIGLSIFGNEQTTQGVCARQSAGSLAVAKLSISWFLFYAKQNRNKSIFFFAISRKDIAAAAAAAAAIVRKESSPARLLPRKHSRRPPDVVLVR